jgi:hypothetical protein
MLASLPMQRACRARLLTLVAAEVAGDTIAATATGYTVAAPSSFLAAAFAVGQEVTASGFTTPGNNGVRLVAGVATAALTAAGTAVEAAGSGRALRVLLPTRRAWEGVDFTPVSGQPYVTDRWLGGPTTLVTTTRDGWVESTPQYQVQFYTRSGVGMDAGASYADAVLRLFRPGTAITAADGTVARVRGDTGPFRSALTLDTPGWSVVSVTIPLRAETRNI